MWPPPRSLLHLKKKELGAMAVTTELEAVDTPGTLYHLHIYTGMVVMVELVELHTRILVGSQLPRTHMVLHLSHMDLPLLSHTDLPLLSHMDLPLLSRLVLLLKVMGLLTRNQIMGHSVAPTDRRNLAVGQERITLN
jgi:hypothetical protein